jgi:uncharacterized Zn-binding protein involved in type VI secretion
MPAVARQNDADSSDGHLISDLSTDVIINGQAAVLQGSMDSPHAPYGKKHPPHDAATVNLSSDSVIVNGRGLAYVGSTLTCGHSIASGSSDVDVAA